MRKRTNYFVWQHKTAAKSLRFTTLFSSVICSKMNIFFIGKSCPKHRDYDASQNVTIIAISRLLTMHRPIPTPHVIAICGMTALNTKLRCEVDKVPYTFQLQTCSNLGHVLCTWGFYDASHDETLRILWVAYSLLLVCIIIRCICFLNKLL